MNKMPTPDLKEPSIEAGTAHRANHTKIDLRQVKGGIVEIWRDDELLGMIQPTKSGFRLVMGDVDPDRHSTLFWGGEPFSIQFELGGMAMNGSPEHPGSALEGARESGVQR